MQRIHDSIYSDEVRRFQRAHGMPVAFLEDFIHCGRVCHLLIHNKCGLIHKKMGDPVGDKAGAVRNDNSLLIQTGQKFHHEPQSVR
ncbi:hypothetical protein D3C76_1510660 [compost metagenome]